jgi:hypothetical protein
MASIFTWWELHNDYTTIVNHLTQQDISSIIRMPRSLGYIHQAIVWHNSRSSLAPQVKTKSTRQETEKQAIPQSNIEHRISSIPDKIWQCSHGDSYTTITWRLHDNYTTIIPRLHDDCESSHPTRYTINYKNVSITEIHSSKHSFGTILALPFPRKWKQNQN